MPARAPRPTRAPNQNQPSPGIIVRSVPKSAVDRWLTVEVIKAPMPGVRSRVRNPMPIETTTNIAPISVADAAPMSIKKSCHSGSGSGMRSLCRPQFLGGGAIEAAVRQERDAVVALRRLGAVEPVGDIGGDLLGVAFCRIAKPAAA